VNDTKTSLLLETNLGPLAVNIFDPVVVKISANGMFVLVFDLISHSVESRSHMTKAKVALIHFGKNLKAKDIVQPELIEMVLRMAPGIILFYFHSHLEREY
jgi:hypothetical protein